MKEFKMKDVKANAPRAPRSQLVNAGANAPIAPTSQLGLFVAGDIKGGEAAHNYRMSVVAASIREALKGNSRALVEAADLSKGKSKKARSYAAGFAAVGIPARIQYAGKLDAPENEAARAAIVAACARLELEFESAFLQVFHNDAPKAEKKAKATEATSAEATSAAGDEASATDTSAAPVAAELEVSSIVTATISAIGGGLLLDAELDALEKAIQMRRASMAADAALAAMASAPATEGEPA
jgi:hypothetical protein